MLLVTSDIEEDFGSDTGGSGLDSEYFYTKAETYERFEYQVVVYAQEPTQEDNIIWIDTSEDDLEFEVIDTLTSSSVSNPLSARQGTI